MANRGRKQESQVQDAQDTLTQLPTFFFPTPMSVESLGGKFKPLRNIPTAAEHDQKLKDVSKLYEKQFLREMVKAMRGTVSESEFIKANQGEKIFKEQLDQEYVDKWGEKGGIGLADMIYNQLIEKYGPALGIKQPIQKPQGPMELKDSFRSEVKQVSPQKTQVELNRVALGSAVEEIKSPWSGTVLKNQLVAPGSYLMDIQHDNGLRSQFSFSGLTENFTEGQNLQAGQRLGYLSPEAKSLYWSLIHDQKNVSE